MTIDPRVYAENDKRMPTPTAGDDGKTLVYDHATGMFVFEVKEGDLPTGTILSFMGDTLPDGYVAVGATYDYDTYPALGELFGSSAGNTFDVPDIVFQKNSDGVNTGTEEAEEIGPHDHTADTYPAHGHSVGVNPNGDHAHYDYYSSYAGGGGSGGIVYSTTTQRGNHPHSATCSNAGAHSHVIDANTGTTNQPACTLVNFGIKT